MRTIHSIAELRSALAPLRGQSRRIGFVPTMGALHNGHLSLIKLSKAGADVTVVSIFVNPMQFGPNEDFEKYPRTLEDDIHKLVEAEVDFLFCPSAGEIYPRGHSTAIHVDGVSALFEGTLRPAHFDGVATIVGSLFNIVQPNVAFFGQKDAQQVAVIKRMVRDLHFSVEIVVGDTIREAGSLALSSRNRYLSENHRKESEALASTLEVVRKELRGGANPEIAKHAGIKQFESLSSSGKLDYLEIVNSETFQPTDSFERKYDGDELGSRNSGALTIIIAARFGETRLIDNLVV